MLFPVRALNILEYGKILEMLADCAGTDGAKARARSLMPTDDFDEVMMRQRRTDDAKKLIGAKGFPPFSAPESVVPAAERAYKGGVLSQRELLDILSLLRSARLSLDYISSDKPFNTVLDEIFSRLIPDKKLETKIERTVISEDMIADEASPALTDIRRKIRSANNRIRETLQNYVGGARLKYLQENIVTMRNGRYVVPVKAEYRNELKGLVHDTSSSGATLFVEPIAVVEANNELKSLAGEEEAEIERILAELSADVGELSSVITLDYHNITELAFCYACASLAMQMRAEKPIITKNRVIDLKRARHPLIDRERVVPIDVRIGESTDTLVITGPNTGGKTVTLKTMGLLTVMAQSGLQIPASEESRIGVFGEVLADIGDEQSIEASLSTFSSHMVNIVDILSEVTDRSLVLFDELGSGTDPVEGAALAVSVLEYTRAAGALSASTTHYPELKVYALDTPGVQNASCEFDLETLRPTYRLIVGTPGRSNAFAISEKLGLPHDIIARAKQLIEHDNKRFEDVIDRLDSTRAEMEHERDAAEKMRREFEDFKRTSEEELKKKLSRGEEEIKKNTEKARQILESARASSEFIFRQLEDVRKEENRDKRDEMTKRAREEVRKRLAQTENLFSGIDVRDISEDDDYKLPRPLKVGDKVYLVTFGKEGTVEQTKDKNGLVSVSSGILKAKVPEEKLRLIDGNVKYCVKQAVPKVNEGKVRKNIVSTFRPEVDVRGLIGDDAWFIVDKYLDDAVLAGVPSVRIIHGKGTGALRAALWKYLKNDPRVKSYRHGEYGEGDAGVTVVEFKNS